MNVSPINNNINYNRPSFGAIRGAENLPNEILKEVVNNHEFVKLTSRLATEGKDLFLRFEDYGLGSALRLGKGSYNETINTIVCCHGEDILEKIRNFKQAKMDEREQLLTKIDEINSRIDMHFYPELMKQLLTKLDEIKSNLDVLVDSKLKKN